MDEGERDHLDERIALQAGTIRRFRAALKLLSPDDITPAGRRVLENILDAEGHQDSTELCKHCSEPIYQTDMGRWRHTNGMYVCTIPMPPPRPKAEPESPDKRCEKPLMDGRNEIRCWGKLNHEGPCT